MEKVRPVDVLWDVKHPDYNKITLKRVIWETVCRELRTEHPEATTHLTTGYFVFCVIISDISSVFAGSILSQFSFKNTG